MDPYTTSTTSHPRYSPYFPSLISHCSRLTSPQILELSLLTPAMGLHTCWSLPFFVSTHSLYFNLIVTLSRKPSLTALTLPTSSHGSTHFLLIATHHTVIVHFFLFLLFPLD